MRIARQALPILLEPRGGGRIDLAKAHGGFGGIDADAAGGDQGGFVLGFRVVGHLRRRISEQGLDQVANRVEQLGRARRASVVFASLAHPRATMSLA